MSVANCVKRAFLIWLSTLAFGNAVGIYNGLGTLMLISGVMCYNYVKQQAGATTVNESVANTDTDELPLTPWCLLPLKMVFELQLSCDAAWPGRAAGRAESRPR
jgi:hypothetical protein